MQRRHVRGLTAVALCCACAATVALSAQTPLPVRGIYIDGPSHREIPLFVRFITDALPKEGINTLVVDFRCRYQFTSIPEEGRGSVLGEPLSYADMKAIVAACRAAGVRLIPKMGMLSYSGLYYTHPELMENYPASATYCPLHTNVHPIVFALIDELATVCEADVFHVGMDEVRELPAPTCPRCSVSGLTSAQLFAGEVTALRNHLTATGREMWMFGDRFLDASAWGLGEWEASMNGMAGALQMVTNDIVITDWHYGSAPLTAMYFATNGFRVMYAPWYNEQVARNELALMRTLRANPNPAVAARGLGMLFTNHEFPGVFIRGYYGEGALSNPLLVSTLKAVCQEIRNDMADSQAPTVPSGVTTNAVTSTSVSLTWNPSTDAGGVGVNVYRVYQGGAWVGTSATNSFTHSGLTPNTTYSYRVSALDMAANESGQSSNALTVATLIGDIQPPAVPSGLATNSTTSSSVSLAWNAATDDVGVTGYKVYQGSDSGILVGTSATNGFAHRGLDPNTAYRYMVAAHDAAGNVSSNSAPLIVTTAGGVLASNGPSLWLKADAGVTASGGRVSGWTDQSGNGRNATQPTSAKQPFLVNNALHGKPAVRFDGTNSCMVFGDIMDNVFAGAGKQFTMYAVARTRSTTAQVILSKCGDSDHGEFHWMFEGYESVFNYSSLNNSQGREKSSAQKVPANQFAILGVTYRGNVNDNDGLDRIGLRIDGVEQIGGTKFAFGAIPDIQDGPEPLALGTINKYLCLDGDIAEVLVYDHALSLTQAQGVESYLAGKYGLMSGPDTEAPSVPSNVTVTAVTDTSVSLAWTASTDNVDVVAYRILESGSVVGSNTVASFTHSGLAPETPYSYTVQAGDAAGNWSGVSTPPVGATTLEALPFPTNGLVGYWPLDENGGSTANDASGNGYHGTLTGVNTPVWTAPGKLGASSLLFNIQNFSSPSRVDLPAGPDALATNAGFTISAWCHPDAAPGNSYCKTTVLAGQTPNNDTGGNVLGYYYNASGDYRFYMRFGYGTGNNTAYTAMSPAPSPVGIWYHVAGVVDRAGGTVKIYIDGVPAATNVFAGGTAAYAYWPAYHWKFGAWGNNREDPNYGRQTLDEVRIYNRALSAAEVMTLAGVAPPDTQAPTLSVVTPANLSYTTNSQVAVAGTAADASGVASVTVNGVAASTSNGFTNWNRTVTGLAAGTNVVTVVAVDTQGNAVTNVVRVIYAAGAFDGNSDGLPDDWQIRYFGFGFKTNALAAPDADPDGDRMNNRDERLTFTDPLDGLDYMGISESAWMPDGAGFMLRWKTVSGQVYVVQHSTNLKAWGDVNPPINAEGSTADWTDSSAGDDAAKFYRIKHP